MAGSPINWGPLPKGDPTLLHPLYQRWNRATLDYVAANLAALKTDLKQVMVTNSTAGIVAYLAYLIRLSALVAD